MSKSYRIVLYPNYYTPYPPAPPPHLIYPPATPGPPMPQAVEAQRLPPYPRLGLDWLLGVWGQRAEVGIILKLGVLGWICQLAPDQTCLALPREMYRVILPHGLVVLILVRDDGKGHVEVW